jgi:hypothetical protein
MPEQEETPDMISAEGFRSGGDDSKGEEVFASSLCVVCWVRSSGL